MRNQFLSASLLALVACGGGQKVRWRSRHDAPAAAAHRNSLRMSPTQRAAPDRAARSRSSKDAKADYKAAIESFKDQDKGGNWNESACRGAADKFAAVAREHNLVEAQFMVGLSLPALRPRQGRRERLPGTPRT